MYKGPDPSSQETGRARYRQEPLFRPEGPEFEPIPLEKRKAFQFRRGPTGKTLYAAYFGVMVLGHYVYATGAWDQRDLYAERHNVWGSVTTYLQAEADRKYLQSRKTRVEAEEKLLFPKEISEGKMEANFEEAQFNFGLTVPGLQDEVGASRHGSLPAVALRQEDLRQGPRVIVHLLLSSEEDKVVCFVRSSRLFTFACLEEKKKKEQGLVMYLASSVTSITRAKW